MPGFPVTYWYLATAPLWQMQRVLDVHKENDNLTNQQLLGTYGKAENKPAASSIGGDAWLIHLFIYK